MKDVFISYSTKDQAAKEELKQVFDNQGISYWLDETSIEIGGSLNEQIEAGLREARFTVLLVSENSLLSAWVSKESLFRLKEELFTGKTTLLPILLDAKVFEDEFPFRMYDKFNAEIEKQKHLRAQAEARKMKTTLYNERIEGLEDILPNITDIIAKLTASLSANFTDPARKANDLQKLIQTIQDQTVKASISETSDSITITKNITIPKGDDAGITQTIVNLGGILKMEHETFKPQKILWMSAKGQNNTLGTANFKHIKETLQASTKREQFILEIEPEVSLDNFLPLIMQYEPNILHIWLPNSSEKGVFFPNSAAEPQVLTDEDMRDFFGMIAQKYTLDLLVLSADYSFAQAEAAHTLVKQAIGMQEALPEKAASLYAQKLYELIFDGEQLEFAHNSAKISLKMAKIAPTGKLPTHEIPKLIVN
jgi:hypothetical protein